MRAVNVKLLPDKSGRVRIHWFVHDEAGPVETPAATTMTALGAVRLGGARGRIACTPAARDVLPRKQGGEIHVTPHSDDVRAVTCPECMATPEYSAVLARLGELLETAGNVS